MSIVVKCPSCGKRLDAPSSWSGKLATCPVCGDQIRIAEEALDAEPVPLPSDAPSESAAAEASLDGLSAKDYGGTLPKRKPCPVCGESIVATAAKCRFCGELFDSRLKTRAKSEVRNSQDENLSAVDCVACVLVSGVTCVLGVVYMIQGKRRGTQMFAISVVAMVFWFIVVSIVEAALSEANRMR
jgi:predicted RNA-binding Zn-ribbon protein involved in translation (DUF1610 family)